MKKMKKYNYFVLRFKMSIKDYSEDSNLLGTSKNYKKVFKFFGFSCIFMFVILSLLIIIGYSYPLINIPNNALLAIFIINLLYLCVTIYFIKFYSINKFIEIRNREFYKRSETYIKIGATILFYNSFTSVVGSFLSYQMFHKGFMNIISFLLGNVFCYLLLLIYTKVFHRFY
jgi:hypothetical protein